MSATRLPEVIAVNLRSVATWLRGYLRALEDCRATGLAAELAFWLFLSLVPLAAVVGLIAAHLAMNDLTLLRALVAAFPRASRDLILDELARVSASNGGSVGPLATVVFVWLASSGVHATFDALELTSHTPPRTWLHKRALSALACIVLSVAAAAIVVLGVGLDAFRRLLHPVATTVVVMRPFAAAMRALFVVGAAIGIVAALFSVATRRPRGVPIRIFPGATVAVLAQVVMGLGYAQFISTTGDGGAYLAGLAVIGVTMTALYLSALSLLMGATLNQYLDARARSSAP
ncbi:MAG: YihY/virulence factor BrkB family protein [Polyangiales bacterium]